MALRLKLKPGERVIVGGAVVRNGSSRAELFVENDTPVLREVPSPVTANTAVFCNVLPAGKLAPPVMVRPSA